MSSHTWKKKTAVVLYYLSLCCRKDYIKGVEVVYRKGFLLVFPGDCPVVFWGTGRTCTDRLNKCLFIETSFIPRLTIQHTNLSIVLLLLLSFWVYDSKTRSACSVIAIHEKWRVHLKTLIKQILVLGLCINHGCSFKAEFDFCWSLIQQVKLSIKTPV